MLYDERAVDLILIVSPARPHAKQRLELARSTVLAQSNHVFPGKHSSGTRLSVNDVFAVATERNATDVHADNSLHADNRVADAKASSFCFCENDSAETLQQNTGND